MNKKSMQTLQHWLQEIPKCTDEELENLLIVLYAQKESYPKVNQLFQLIKEGKLE